MLDFYTVKSKTAWMEKNLGDVLVVHKSEKDFNDSEERILISKFDPSNYGFGDKLYFPMRKMTYDGWLMVGYSDWEEVEIPYNESHRWMIKSFFEYIKKEESYK